MVGILWRVIPFAFFVVSGACGLVYEVTWGKYLALFLGNTSLAYMCVLASYMGGLALGSFIIGSASTRIRRPLALYGWLESAIGLYAVAFPFLIHPVESLVLSQGESLGFGTSAWVGLKLASALAVLLLPTVLMGGTFPLLMRHYQPATIQQEDKAEWLYTTNCAGAVAGGLLAGFVSIPSIGVSHTLWYVGVANVLLGAAAVAMGAGPAVKEADVAPARKNGKPDGKANPLLRPVYAAIAVSGATSMVYELVWIRIFGITLGGTTYAFTLMVSAFITGIAAGSLVVGAVPWLRRNALIAFALAETAIGVAILASLPVYQRLPYVFWKWASLLRPSPESMWLNNLFQYTMCFIVMVVPTVFFGATLPLAIKSVARRDERLGRDSGFVYGANTLGTLAGALLTGLVLIPVLGSRHSLEWAIVVNIAVGALLLWFVGQRRARTAALILVPAAIVLVVAVPEWHPASLKMGSYGMGSAPSSWDGYKRFLDSLRVKFFDEDGSATVAVYTAADSGYGQPDDILSINGKPDASSYADLPTEVLLGQAPMMLKPDAEDVLVIGLGSGVTAASALTHPYATVDCVEISPAVARAARCFSSVNGNVLDNDRFRLIVEDARTYVGATRKKYDVIVSEPSHPWVAGVANLFSLEFLRSAEKVLKPGGVLVQWFQGYDMSDELVGVMLRTLRKVFPSIYIFEGASDDYIIVAAREPVDPDFAAMDERMNMGAVLRDLGRVGIDSTAAFLGRQVIGPSQAAKLAGKGPLNTDDLPVLEYKAPVAMYSDSVPAKVKNNDQRLGRGDELFSAAYLKARPLDPASCISLILSYSDPRTDNPRLSIALLRGCKSRWPGDPRILAMYSERTRNVDPQGACLSAKAAAKAMQDPMTYSLAAEAEFRELSLSHSVFTPQDFGPAIDLMGRAARMDPGNQRYAQRRAEMIASVR